MKIIKYNLIAYNGLGEPIQGAEVELGWNEVNEEIARNEAWNGEIIVKDDGRPEQPKTLESRVDTLELDSAETKEALEMILSGVTE